MIRAYSKAIAQLSDPKIRAIIWKSVAGTILGFIFLIIAVGWALANTALFEIAWVETAVDIFGGLATAIIAIVLFPGIVGALVSVLLEDVADAVEARHYPGLGTPLEMGWGTLITTSLRLILLTVVLNLLFLPLYLIPGINIAVYYGVNGVLLGREYFEVVALRRLSPSDVAVLKKRHRSSIWVMGAATAFLFTIPVVNMVAPVLGTAAMVHFFHRARDG
jgi:CysZ protein